MIATSLADLEEQLSELKGDVHSVTSTRVDTAGASAESSPSGGTDHTHGDSTSGPAALHTVQETQDQLAAQVNAQDASDAFDTQSEAFEELAALVEAAASESESGAGSQDESEDAHAYKQAAAATRIAAVQRGNRGRVRAAGLRAEMKMNAAAKSAAQAQLAIGPEHGSDTDQRANLEDELVGLLATSSDDECGSSPQDSVHRNSAATRIAAAHRGQQGRSRAAALKQEKQKEAVDETQPNDPAEADPEVFAEVDEDDTDAAFAELEAALNSSHSVDAQRASPDLDAMMAELSNDADELDGLDELDAMEAALAGDLDPEPEPAPEPKKAEKKSPKKPKPDKKAPKLSKKESKAAKKAEEKKRKEEEKAAKNAAKRKTKKKN